MEKTTIFEGIAKIILPKNIALKTDQEFVKYRLYPNIRGTKTPALNIFDHRSEVLELVKRFYGANNSITNPLDSRRNSPFGQYVRKNNGY